MVISRLQCTEGFVSFAVLAYSLSFLLVVVTVDILLACWSVDVVVRGTIVITVLGEFIVL